jgi:hypothetical protein
MALKPAAVRDEPVITPVPKQHPTQTDNPNSTNNPPVDDPSNDGDPGDILFRGMWKNQHETIVDVRTLMPTSIRIPTTYSENKKRRRRRNASKHVLINIDHSCHSWFPQPVYSDAKPRIC